MHTLVGLALLLLGAAAQATAQAAVEPLAAAPDFTLRQSGGTPLRLAEQRGRVVLVNFRARTSTACGTARAGG